MQISLDDLHQELAEFHCLIQNRLLYFLECFASLQHTPKETVPVEQPLEEPVPEIKDPIGDEKSLSVEPVRDVPIPPLVEIAEGGDLIIRSDSRVDVCKLSKQQRNVAKAFSSSLTGILDHTVAVELVRPKWDRKKRIPLETLERRLRTVLSKINRKIKDLCAGTPLFYYNDLSVKVF